MIVHQITDSAEMVSQMPQDIPAIVFSGENLIGRGAEQIALGEKRGSPIVVSEVQQHIVSIIGKVCEEVVDYLGDAPVETVVSVRNLLRYGPG